MAMKIPLLVSGMMFLLSACRSPERERETMPYRFRYTIEQLRDEFSDERMVLTGLHLEELEKVNRNGP